MANYGDALAKRVTDTLGNGDGTGIGSGSGGGLGPGEGGGTGGGMFRAGVNGVGSPLFIYFPPPDEPPQTPKPQHQGARLPNLTVNPHSPALLPPPHHTPAPPL